MENTSRKKTITKYKRLYITKNANNENNLIFLVEINGSVQHSLKVTRYKSKTYFNYNISNKLKFQVIYLKCSNENNQDEAANSCLMIILHLENSNKN